MKGQKMSVEVKYDPAEWLDNNWSAECLECGWFLYVSTQAKAEAEVTVHKMNAHGQFKNGPVVTHRWSCSCGAKRLCYNAIGAKLDSRDLSNHSDAEDHQIEIEEI
jgi:hypothetical protein